MATVANAPFPRPLLLYPALIGALVALAFAPVAAQICGDDRQATCTATASIAAAPEQPPVDKQAGAAGKVSSPLRTRLAQQEPRALDAGPSPAGIASASDLVRVDPGGDIQVYVELVEFRPEHVAQLESHGLRTEVSLPQFRLVQGWLPASQIDAVAALPFVKEIRQPDYSVKNAAGLAGTQGEGILRADLARATFGVTGAGVKIGVISNGVQFLAASQGSGDLGPVEVLRASSGNEGTAMLEIVHDLAPGAALAFWGVATSAEMVQGITALRNAGARVMVDDVAFLGEPKFQDGMVAQTIRGFAQAGGVYVGAAGNQAKQHYRATYTRAAGAPPGWAGLHNHLAGAVDVGNSLVLPPGCSLLVFLQWNNPWGAARDDFDLFIGQASNGAIVAQSINVQNGTQNPFEVAGVVNNGATAAGVFIAIGEWARRTGTPNILDYFARVDCVSEAQDFLQYATAGQSLTGNHAVIEMLTVAALGAETPGVVQPYSSIGPHDIFFPAFQSRAVPNISAIDCVQTRTGQLGHFGNPFCGTSAAAPHVAAIAALLLEAAPGLSAAQVREMLVGSAVDLGPPGFDLVHGGGRADALNALNASVPAFAEIVPSGTSFRAGQTLALTLRASNPPGGQPLDLYVGALWPDDDTIAFLTGPNVLGGLGRYSAPASVFPMQVLDGSATVNTPVLEYTFPLDGIPVGTYRVFAALFRQGSLADNALNDGDLVWLDYFVLTYTP
jgi:subtilisin family serine protease